MIPGNPKKRYKKKMVTVLVMPWYAILILIVYIISLCDPFTIIFHDILFVPHLKQVICAIVYEAYSKK